MRKNLKKAVTLLLVMLMLFSVCIFSFACENEPEPIIVNLKDYQPVATEFSYNIDNSIPISGADDALLSNPDRGLRGEIYITLGTEKSYPSNNQTAYERLESELSRYADDKPVIMQTYVYLIEYYNKPISKSAFAQLKAFFETIREKNVRMLLRFAYEFDDYDSRGPRTSRIISHTKQIKKFFDENLELVNDTVYAMQLGMIGLWGEGHGSKYYHDFGKITKAVAEMTPSNIMIMARTPELLTSVPEEYESRYGIHDDFLVGIEHKWGMMPFSDPQYTKLQNKSKYVLTDGEMPWGRDTTVPDIDHKLFLKQCLGYGLTTLSLTHNYKEDNDRTYHLEKWKTVYMTAQELEEEGLPYNPYMLIDGKISVYEYIRHHLGYQLAASNLSTQDNKLEFMLTNFGLAAPFEFEMEIKIGDTITKVDAFDAMSLKQFGQLKLSFDYNASQSVGIKIYHKRNKNLTVKFANSIQYINGFNFIIN